MSDDIVDAEFETLGATRPGRAPDVAGAAAAARAPDRPGAGLGVFAAGRMARPDRDARPIARPDRAARPMPLPAFAAIAAIGALAAFYVAGGHVLLPGPVESVRGAPSATAAPVSPLVLDEATARVETASGRPVFVIGATIVNDTAGTHIVPPVRIRFERPGRSGAMVHVIARGERLAPGERMAFTSRIPAGDYAGLRPRLSFAPIL
ncbi:MULTISPECIES: hypothetical protein [unclassified Roseitalea]|uniref:hypothetical protein n=1 Tax=unclassified Roseitalea TaxID=2639107 RepID=UPI00273FAC4D|nr:MULTISPECIES: hypothetical protein [unclassified Roseitalea]